MTVPPVGLCTAGHQGSWPEHTLCAGGLYQWLIKSMTTPNLRRLLKKGDEACPICLRNKPYTYTCHWGQGNDRHPVWGHVSRSRLAS